MAHQYLRSGLPPNIGALCPTYTLHEHDATENADVCLFVASRPENNVACRAGWHKTAAMTRSAPFGGSMAVIYDYLDMVQYCNAKLH